MPKNSHLWLKIGIIIFLSFNLLILVARAQDNKLPTLTAPDIKVSIPGMEPLKDIQCAEGSCTIPWFGQYIAGLQSYAIGIVGIIAVIVIMIGGTIWLMAGGNSSQIEEAKKFISGGIFGLFLTFGAYVILYIINPNLTVMKGLEIDRIKRINLEEILADIKNGDPISKEAAELMNQLDTEKLISHSVGKSANNYKTMNCDRSLFNGGQAIDFFTTGYYKPPYQNTQAFFCDVGLQCACPPGSSQIGPNKSLCGHKYKYCSPFPAGTPYCNNTASGVPPEVGQVAADGNCFNFGDKLCLGGKITLTVTDRGSAIKGRRLDIFSGSDRNTALARTGIGKITLGACP